MIDAAADREIQTIRDLQLRLRKGSIGIGGLDIILIKGFDPAQRKTGIGEVVKIIHFAPLMENERAENPAEGTVRGRSQTQFLGDGFKVRRAPVDRENSTGSAIAFLQNAALRCFIAGDRGQRIAVAKSEIADQRYAEQINIREGRPFIGVHIRIGVGVPIAENINALPVHDRLARQFNRIAQGELRRIKNAAMDAVVVRRVRSAAMDIQPDIDIGTRLPA